jgi:hypothetical protein
MPSTLALTITFFFGAFLVLSLRIVFLGACTFCIGAEELGAVEKSEQHFFRMGDWICVRSPVEQEHHCWS